MTLDYSTKELTGRELTEDEEYILYGKPSDKSITFFKADNFYSIMNMMDSLYHGEEVTLPFTPKNNCMYLFYDLPVGTKHYFYDMMEAGFKNRTHIGSMEAVEMKYLLNTFLLPIVKEGMIKIHPAKSMDGLASDFWASVGIIYSHLPEIFSAGLLVMTNGNKVVSICSAGAKIKSYDYVGLTNPAISKHLQSSHATLREQEKVEQLSWYNYHIPIDVQKRSSVDNAALTFSTSVLSNRLFEWAKGTYIVISNKYLRLNGFVSNDTAPQLALTAGIFMPSVTALSSNTQKAVNYFSSAIENFIFSGSNYSFHQMNKMFESGNINGINCGGYYSPKNSMLAFNKDTLDVIKKPYLELVGYSEHISLDDGVLGELRDGFLNTTPAVGSEKYAKSEFRLNPEPINNEDTYVSHRYDIVKTSDGKLLFLTKTSKAKEALKQAKISRKITESMTPVLNFAVHLFAARDMEHPGLNRAATLPTYSKLFTGYQTCNWNALHPEIAAAYMADLDKFMTELSKNTATLATAALKDLHTCFNTASMLTTFTGYNTIQNVRCGGQGWRQTLLTQIAGPAQKDHAFDIMFRDIAFKFHGHSPLFSPSSNNLQFMSLGTSMYAKSSHAEIPKEFSNLKNDDHLSGAQLHHYYTNNFISISEAMDTTIERGKTNNYISCYEQTVPISTCFTWSQEASDAWSATRKCKTFTDYFNWYKANMGHFFSIINTVIKPKDEIAAETLKHLTGAYLIILEGLSVAETPYLPVVVAKTRGRKPKVATTTTTTETEDAEDTTEDLTAITGEVIDVKDTLTVE